MWIGLFSPRPLCKVINRDTSNCLGDIIVLWFQPFACWSITLAYNFNRSGSTKRQWIHILGKQCLPCVKGKVTVYVTCQCSENRCFWRVIDKALRCTCITWCTVLFRSIETYHTPTKRSDAQPLVEGEKQFECHAVEIWRS